MSTDQPTAKIGLSEANRATGAAVHHDLYAAKPDPVLEQARLLQESRKLGIGFCVFFALILGGISFSLNGLWAETMAVLRITTKAEGLQGTEEGDLPRIERIERAELFDVTWDDGRVFAATQIDNFSSDSDDLSGEQTKGQRDFTVVINGRQVARVYLPDRPGKKITYVTFPAQEVRGDQPGTELQLVPGPTYAWLQAKLLRTVPTRFLVLIGLAMGGLALLSPTLLIPVYKGWMRTLIPLTKPIGWVNTRLILGFFFFALLTPWSLFKGLFTKDALNREPKPKDESYWIMRSEQRARDHFRRPF